MATKLNKDKRDMVVQRALCNKLDSIASWIVEGEDLDNVMKRDWNDTLATLRHYEKRTGNIMKLYKTLKYEKGEGL